MIGLLAADALLALGFVLTAGIPQVPVPIVYYFDLRAERNLPTWYSSLQLALVGLLLLVFSWARRRAWAAVAALGFAFLSLDEATILHERFGRWMDTVGAQRVDTLLPRTGIWVLILPPVLLAAASVIAWAGWKDLRPHPRVSLLGLSGLLVFVGGAAGVEALANLVPRDSRLFSPQFLIEESLEMVGVTLLVWFAFELLRAHGVRLKVEEDKAGDDPSNRPADHDHIAARRAR